MANANASNDSGGNSMSLVDRITGFVTEPFGIALALGTVLALLAAYWFLF